MSICWTEDGFNMAPPEQPTLSEIKTEKEHKLTPNLLCVPVSWSGLFDGNLLIINNNAIT